MWDGCQPPSHQQAAHPGVSPSIGPHEGGRGRLLPGRRTVRGACLSVWGAEGAGEAGGRGSGESRHQPRRIQGLWGPQRPPSVPASSLRGASSLGEQTGPGQDGKDSDARSGAGTECPGGGCPAAPALPTATPTAAASLRAPAPPREPARCRLLLVQRGALARVAGQTGEDVAVIAWPCGRGRGGREPHVRGPAKRGQRAHVSVGSWSHSVRPQ